MQLDSQSYLDFVEKAGKLYFVDTESSGFTGDYDKLYITSVKPYGKPVKTIVIGENACDRGLARDSKELIDDADCIVTFYGKGHDVPLINTRLIRWGYRPLEANYHIDMYYIVKHKLKTSRKSQAHLLEFLHDSMEQLGIKPEKKMTVNPNVWADMWTHYAKHVQILQDRCESDVKGLEALYRTTRYLIKDIKIY